jgi:hypothetical protein
MDYRLASSEMTITANYGGVLVGGRAEVHGSSREAPYLISV